MNRYDKEKARKNIPFSVIQAACRGSPDEMLIVIQHYTPYIVSLSKRRMIDLCGNECIVVDEEIRRRLEGKLMEAILKFEL